MAGRLCSPSMHRAQPEAPLWALCPHPLEAPQCSGREGVGVLSNLPRLCPCHATALKTRNSRQRRRAWREGNVSACMLGKTAKCSLRRWLAASKHQCRPRARIACRPKRRCLVVQQQTRTCGDRGAPHTSTLLPGCTRCASTASSESWPQPATRHWRRA